MCPGVLVWIHCRDRGLGSRFLGGHSRPVFKWRFWLPNRKSPLPETDPATGSSNTRPIRPGLSRYLVGLSGCHTLQWEHSMNGKRVSTFDWDSECWHWSLSQVKRQRSARLTLHEESLLVASCRLGQDVLPAGKVGSQALPAEVGKRHASLPACLLAVDEKRSLLGVPVGEIQADDLAPSQATAIQDAESCHPKMAIECLTRLSGSFPNPCQRRVADASRQTMATVQSRSLHPTQGVISGAPGRCEARLSQ